MKGRLGDYALGVSLLVESEARFRLGLPPRLRSSYFICATPRSGSGLLGHMLWQTGWAGQPQEYFEHWTTAAGPSDRANEEVARPWRIPPGAYVAKLKREGTTRNGVLGVKMMADQLAIAIEQLRTLSPEYADLAPHLLLGRVFPRPTYVWITRKDKIRQAVSWAKAAQSGQWFYVRPQARPSETDPGGARGRAAPGGSDLTFDFQALLHYHREILAQERLWDEFFLQAGVDPYRVVYEEFVENLESTTREILRYIHVPRHWRAEFYDKYERRPQGDALDLEWARRFREELGRLPGP